MRKSNRMGFVTLSANCQTVCSLLHLRHSEHNGAGFYKGRIAAAIVEALQSRGSVMAPEDLATHTSTFTQPISTLYRGHRIYEVPPPTQA